MLAKRIIPCLDIRDGQTVKGINFVGLRQVGDPVELGAKYAAEGADELVYLDISASEEGRRTFTELVARIAARIDIPFTVGGGISSVDDASRLLDAGADKITLNSAAVANPALIDAIKDGTVPCIGTDHAPLPAEEKEKGAAGMVGLETAFGVCYTKLCREQRLPLEMLSFLMSAGPAAVLGLADRKGMLEPGYDADVVLVDLDHMYEVHADELHSKSKNCPYDGALLYGKVVTTIKGGKVTFQIEE